MKNFCLIASVISGILFTASIAGLGTIENLIAFGVLDILFYMQYLSCKIDELNNELKNKQVNYEKVESNN